MNKLKNMVITIVVIIKRVEMQSNFVHLRINKNINYARIKRRNKIKLL